MRVNRLRGLLKGDQPTLGTHLHSSWPSMVEAVGHTGLYDYVEFQAQYAPFDHHALDNFCRAAEVHGLGSMIKIDFDERRSVAQRAVGAGFESVLFADCRTADDARSCVAAVRPDTPEDGGDFGAVNRRFSYPRYAGGIDYVAAIRDVVVVIMIEKAEAVENLDEILEVPGVDMIQWGPGDFSMSKGWLGEARSERTREVERHVLKACTEKGIPFRAEINYTEEIPYYLDLGAKHFCVGTDIRIVHEWLLQFGKTMKEHLGPAF